jgi:hypothetical protein
MVPLLSRAALEKMIGASGLKKLEELRGKEIHEKGDEVVDVKNALGYPQFTLDHDYREGGEFIRHSHHLYTPGQDDGDSVGTRYADWHHHGELGCFDGDRGRDPDDSYPDRSFSLVRGGENEMTITVMTPVRSVKM